MQELASISPQNHLTISKLPCSPSLLASTALPVMQDSTSSLPRIPFMSDTQELTSTSPQIPSTSVMCSIQERLDTKLFYTGDAHKETNVREA